LLKVRVSWVFGITGVDPPIIPPFRFHAPVRAGSVSGAWVVGVTTGVGTVVVVVTGAGVVQPAARMLRESTAHINNSKIFMTQNILILYLYLFKNERSPLR
jgi:hypothetical protein